MAVVAVLLSHMHLPYFGGGYVGVDAFFVVSGYVIFADCRRRMATGSYSVVEFLQRRARRLLPQLFLMCATVLALGAFFFLPTDFVRLPMRVLASITATSNWLFAIQSGYFMPASEWNPLLHTWTLSVEIQFYLVFGLILLRHQQWNGRALPQWLGALFCVSLVYCMWPRGTEAPFFDSFARAWEFLLGALLQYMGRPKLSVPLASILATLALAAIGILIATLPREAFFPDFRALIPTCATAVLILTLRDSIFARIFESQPAVQVGRMSYSIYMWHWPLIVFCTYLWPNAASTNWTTIPLIATILALSFMTWRYVEEPARRRSSSGANRLLGVAFLVIAALCGVAWAVHGWPQRFDPVTVRLDSYSNDINPRRDDCHLGTLNVGRIAHPCVYGAQVAPEYAFWSDSHGVELLQAVSPWLAAHGKAGVQFSFSSCAPRLPTSLRNDCDRFNRATIKRIIQDQAITTVVLAGATDDLAYVGDAKWMKEFESAATTLQRAGKRIIIIYPVPNQRFPGPRAMANFQRFSVDFRPYLTRTSDYLARTQAVFATYDRIRARDVDRIYPHRIFCRAESCAISDAQRPFYFDDNHLSLYGARRLVPALTLAMDSR